MYASPAPAFAASSSNPFTTLNQPLTPSSSPFTNYFPQQQQQPLQQQQQQQQPLNAFSNLQQSQFSQSSFF